MGRFNRLRVWQVARELTREIARIRVVHPGDPLVQQMWRSAISVVSNIAEGSERGSDADYRRFLIMARGSCGELEAQLDLARDAGLIESDVHTSLHDATDHVGRMLSLFANRLRPP